MGLKNLIDKYGAGELDKRNWFSMEEPEGDRAITISVEQLNDNRDSCIALPEEQKSR